METLCLITLDNLNDFSGQALRIKHLISGMSSFKMISLISRMGLNDEELMSKVKGYSQLSLSEQENLQDWFRNPLALRKCYILLKEIAKLTQNESIIYTDSIVVPFYRLFSKRKHPLIIEVNGIYSEQLITKGILKKTHPIYQIFRFVEIYAYRNADALISVSEGLKAYLVGQFHVPGSKIHVISNGVDTKLFDIQVDGNQIRQSFKIGKAPVVLFVGSFRAWHGVENLIEALPYVLREMPDIKLMLVGDGPRKAQIQTMVEAKGLSENVIFAGQQLPEAIPGFIAAADICVYYPSYDVPKYGFMGDPIKFYEYMAMGKPIVTTKLKNFAKVVELENCGIIVDGGHEKFGSAIVKLLKAPDLAKTLGTNGRKAVLEKYDWHVIAKRILDVVDDAIQTKKAV